MSDFICFSSIKNSLFVHKKAFVDVIKSIPSKIKDVLVMPNKTTIQISEDSKSFVISIDVKIASGINLKNKVQEIKNYIETHSIYLIDSKPNNIIINMIDYY